MSTTYFIAASMPAVIPTQDVCTALQAAYDEGAEGSFQILQADAQSYLVIFQRDAALDSEYITRRYSSAPHVAPIDHARMQLADELADAGSGVAIEHLVEDLRGPHRGRVFDFDAGAIEALVLREGLNAAASARAAGPDASDMQQHGDATQLTVVLAKAFSRMLSSTLDSESLAQVAASNGTAAYTGACATHDFVDANELMVQAFNEVHGRDPILASDVESDTACANQEVADTRLISAAWNMARKAKFDPTRVDAPAEPAREGLPYTQDELGVITYALSELVALLESPTSSDRDADSDQADRDLETAKRLLAGLHEREEALKAAFASLAAISMHDDVLNDDNNNGREARAPDGDDYNQIFGHAMTAYGHMGG